MACQTKDTFYVYILHMSVFVCDVYNVHTRYKIQDTKLYLNSVW